MTIQYSYETQKILDDFLIDLEKELGGNHEMLFELRGMVEGGTLGNSTAISKVVQMLKDQQYDLKN